MKKLILGVATLFAMSLISSVHAAAAAITIGETLDVTTAIGAAIVLLLVVVAAAVGAKVGWRLLSVGLSWLSRALRG